MKRLFFTVLVVFALVALLEIVSRIILSRIYNRKFDSSLIIDNKYGSSDGLKENATGIVWGKPFHTDEFACRKGPQTYSPKKKKWLFIGDSVTEGVGVDDSSTFASLVAQSVDSINILNYSLIGYSDADYLNVLKTLMANKDSSIKKATVFFCLNDVYGPAKANTLPVMAKSNLVGGLNAWMQDKYATYKLVKLLVYQMSDRYFKYDEQFYKNGNQLFIECMNYLKQCDSVCKANGIKMDVVMLPYRSQLAGKDAGNMGPQNMVKDFCFKEHIAFADPIDFCAKAGNPQKLYLFADEIHFSEEGHKTIAHYILSH